MDTEIIADLSRDSEISSNAFMTPTQARDVMKRLAMQQLNEVVARETFKSLSLEGVGFEMAALRLNGGPAIASDLWDQIQKMLSAFQAYSAADFQGQFIAQFQSNYDKLEPVWDERWRELSNGKRIFEDLRKEGRLKGDLLKVKRRVMSVMRQERTETWSSLESQLKTLVGT